MAAVPGREFHWLTAGATSALNSSFVWVLSVLRLVIYLFHFRLWGIFYISLSLGYWMTFDSDTYMPKSKAPKMDDLDYSK